MNKKSILFIDVYNSGCSQMLEGLLRKMYGDQFDAYSAGITPERVNIHVIKVMAEVGVDLSTHRSKSVDEFRDMQFNCIVCANERVNNISRYLQSEEYMDIDVDDSFNTGATKAVDAIIHYRKMRDKIREWIEDVLMSHSKSGGSRNENSGNESDR